MSDAYICRRGGGLNFKVVGQTTQPTGAENLIWVNTDAVITSWAFSSTGPVSPAEGTVWFATGIESTTAFNALKKNQLSIYPASCKQYISGAWVGKIAKTYQNGTWQEWCAYLFNEGDTFGASWVFANSGYSGNTQTIGQQIVVQVEATGNGWYSPLSYCTTAFDLTKYGKIQFDIERLRSAPNSSYPFIVGVSSTAAGTYMAQTAFTTAGRSIIDVDISALSGMFYPMFTSQGNATSVGNTIKVYSIKLVP